MKLRLAAYIASEDNLDAQTLEYFYFLNKMNRSTFGPFMEESVKIWYLQKEFRDLGSNEAKRVLLAWIKWLKSNPSNTELGL